MSIVETEIGHARMTALCHDFPSLRGRAGTQPWDQHKFARAMSGGQSAGEKLAAAFVLAVWNGYQPSDGGWWNDADEGFRVGRFDVVEAFQRWDAAHQAAFIAWCNDPFYP